MAQISVFYSDLGGNGRRLAPWQYEVAADFQGALRSALLAHWSGAPVIYGFAQPRENVASMFYSRQVIARGRHIVEQNLSLAEDIIRGPLQLEQAEFPQDAATNTWPQADTPFALMNPGAGWGAKQWPAERYGEVASELAKDGLRTLINCGPGEDNVVRAVEQASAGAAQRISCSITELIALTRRARLFIGGDTGPMHLAAALQVPVVAIFGPTNPARNGPFGTRSIVLRSPSSQTSHPSRAAGSGHADNHFRRGGRRRTRIAQEQPWVAGPGARSRVAFASH